MLKSSGEPAGCSGELDLRLIRDCLAGRESSVATLCARLKCLPAIVAALNRRMGRPLGESDLEDVAQEAVLQIWAKLNQYEGRARLESWAYRFCFLILMNHLRRKKRSVSLAAVHVTNSSQPGDDPAGTELIEFDRIRGALEVLGSPDADVIRLKFFHELSFREIGEVLHVSATSAKTYFHRGMDALRRRLGQEKSRTE